MKEKFKKFLSEKKITEEDFNAKEAFEQLALMNEYNTQLYSELEKSLGEKASEKEIDELKKSFQSTTKTVEALALTLKANAEKSGIAETNALKQFSHQVIDNFDKIKTLGEGGSITLKAVGTVTTASGTNTSVPDALGAQVAPPDFINLRGTSLLDLLTVVNTNSPVFPYTEIEPKEGDAGWTAEGATKSQLDHKWITRYAEPKKITAYERITTEVLQDIPRMRSIIEDLLFKKVQLKKEKTIINSTGLSNSPTGMWQYATTYVGTGMSGKVENPNIMDVINAMITEVFTTHNFTDEEPYMPTVVFINPLDFFIYFAAKKDANGMPLYPQATLFNRVTIGNITITPYEGMTQGDILVADASKYNISNYIPYEVTIGWVNDDFIKNQLVIKGEERLHAFVKKFDEKAFLKGQIATILDDLAVVVNNS